jgi:hypothetical protein
MNTEDENMVSVSHWGMHERRPIEINRKPKQFDRVFPYPNLENKDEFRAYFLNIKV